MMTQSLKPVICALVLMVLLQVLGTSFWNAFHIPVPCALQQLHAMASRVTPSRPNCFEEPHSKVSMCTTAMSKPTILKDSYMFAYEFYNYKFHVYCYISSLNGCYNASTRFAK